jgi:hypothetical protein
MTLSEERYPRTRIKPAAMQYLKIVYDAYRRLGLDRSYTDIVSDAILSIPMPTGNGHRPDCPPCADQEDET